jgi:hypothetical protein
MAYKPDYNRLRWKYHHVGCPAQQYEDICGHPQDCAENGGCKDLEPEDPRRDCPWKCNTGDPSCLCAKKRQAPDREEKSVSDEDIYWSLEDE